MDERKLEYFVGVARELSFTRAAANAYVTQSTLSASVRSLEKELGVELLTRSSRSVTLTDAGARFLPQALELLDSMDKARREARASDEALTGELHVGVLSGLAMVDLPRLLGEFHRCHPRIRLKLETSSRGTAGLLQSLRESRLDLAFFGTTEHESRLRTVPLRRYDAHVVVPEGHPLADREEIRLSDLREQQFVDMPLGFGQRTMTEKVFARADMSPNVAVETVEIAAIPKFVEQGLGVALLAPEFIGAELRVRAVPLAEKSARWTLCVGSSSTRPLTAAVARFLELIPAHLAPERGF
ncbi:LysR family transcriptional regulator [Saccharopolyspora phatthalungensis]|uniref:DNA-binding transcriptional LysR family regulator n=1 Tax=Saccharopolyspora phatthalungensis TaxID=664693 RepID=A0A840QBK2_9PSEU|nr:LysR family transcriptional regulator [Saccharopolyspora phatthalungensis]MBB5157317.1 DNA-binding transcriptional LysR family regulator [Saccharopolyspora phatthalungensis]